MKKTGMKVLAGTLAVALTIAMAPVPGAQAAKKVALDKKKLTITAGKTKKLKLKNNKKKVSWKVVSGKKCVKLKAKKKTGVTIVARKKGNAKVQAVVGKKKYTCKVTVKAAKKTPVVTKAPVTTVAPTATPTLSPTPSPTPTPTLSPTPEPTDNPEDALNPEEVKTLRAFISTLKEAGATVSEDILDDTQYEWDDDEGTLSEINWSTDAAAAISGELKIPSFENLYILNVSGTDITSLDVSACDFLEDLDCSACSKLTALNVSGCEELGFLDCSGTALTTLDLSSCPYMVDEDSLEGPDNLEVTYWTPSEEDVIALEKLVNSMIENNGAPTTIAVRDKDGELNEDYYTWDASGHLSEIYWEELGLQGDISLTEFTDLTSVDIYDNAITSLDLSGCSKLEYLDCNSQQNDDGENTLASLKLTGCKALSYLDCSGCALTTLDLSDCTHLDTKDPESFLYDNGVEIITPGGDNLGGDDFDI